MFINNNSIYCGLFVICYKTLSIFFIKDKNKIKSKLNV